MVFADGACAMLMDMDGMAVTRPTQHVELPIYSLDKSICGDGTRNIDSALEICARTITCCETVGLTCTPGSLPPSLLDQDLYHSRSSYVTSSKVQHCTHSGLKKLDLNSCIQRPSHYVYSTKGH